jgi:hypothetical protein
MTCVTQTALAAFIDTTRETISDHVARGTIKKRADGKYDLQECVRAIFKWQSDKLSGRTGNEELAKERALLVKQQRVAIQDKNAYARGDLVSLKALEKVVTPLFYTMREIALGTPGKIADAVAEACGGDRALVFRIIDDEIRQMLTAMSEPEIISRAYGDKDRRRRAAVADVEETA